jgi:metal-responsive CopG/Arc/MetJ family transcriptional regulator
MSYLSTLSPQSQSCSSINHGSKKQVISDIHALHKHDSCIRVSLLAAPVP